MHLTMRTGVHLQPRPIYPLGDLWLVGAYATANPEESDSTFQRAKVRLYARPVIYSTGGSRRACSLFC